MGDITECVIGEIPNEITALSLPGQIKFRANIDPNASPEDSLYFKPLIAHELYHQLQWYYVGFNGSGCGYWGDPVDWYRGLFEGERNGWLMEDTATWVEAQVFPTQSLQAPLPSSNRRASGYYFFLRNYLDSYTAASLLSEPVDYEGGLFFRFLEEKLAPVAGPTPPHIQVWQVLSDTVGQPVGKSSLQAIATVFQSFPATSNSWAELFDDFAVANYLQDYSHASIFQDAPVVQVPIAEELQPIANPPTPLPRGVRLADHAALYYEIYPNALNVAGGADATGATLSVAEFRSGCVSCTLDTLVWRSGAAMPVQTSYFFTNTLRAVLADDFGLPTGTLSVTLVLANGTDARMTGSFTITATDNLPIVPRNLRVTADVPNNEIDLRWNAVREDGIRYNVYRHTSPSVPIDPAHLLVGNLTNPRHSDDTAAPCDRYYYIVTAVDREGNEGLPSASRSAVLPCPTPTVTPSPTRTSTPTSTPTVTPTPVTAPCGGKWRFINYAGVWNRADLRSEGLSYSECRNGPAGRVIVSPGANIPSSSTPGIVSRNMTDLVSAPQLVPAGAPTYRIAWRRLGWDSAAGRYVPGDWTAGNGHLIVEYRTLNGPWTWCATIEPTAVPDTEGFSPYRCHLLAAARQYVEWKVHVIAPQRMSKNSSLGERGAR